MLSARNISVSFDDYRVVSDVSFAVDEGEWLMLVGPNGAGKSTLINAVSRSVPYSGQIFYKNTDISRIKPATLARNIGIMSQHNAVAYAFTVDEIVSLGRYSHKKGLFEGKDEDGAALVEKALRLTGMDVLRNKKITELSGGEVQRAFLAQVFAQNPNILILDEPANHLDLVYQKQIFDLVAQWVKQPDKAVISVVHDLSLAKRYGTNVLLMKNGRCEAIGKTEDVMTAKNLEKVYDMDVYAWMNTMLSQWAQ